MVTPTKGFHLRVVQSNISDAQFLKELAAAAKNPLRERGLQDIARLKSNNDIMRERLLAANAERDALKTERDRYLELLLKHNIDPSAA